MPVKRINMKCTNHRGVHTSNFERKSATVNASCLTDKIKYTNKYHIAGTASKTNRRNRVRIDTHSIAHVK